MTSASPGPVAAGGPAVRGGADAGLMLATVRELAADRFTGRRVGTAGGRAAAAWLADRLSDLGATVTLDQFEFTGVKELQATPTFTTRDLELVHRRDFAEQLSSADLAQPLAGLLASPAETSWTGRWVVVPLADEQTLGRARTEGAAGLVVPRGVDEAGWMPKMIAGPPTGSVPIVSVRTDLHAELATWSGQQVAVSVPMRTITTTGTNVYGVLAAPASGGLSVLLTAHFDGVGDDPGQRFPSAADNASGVAVVLEVARQLGHDLLPGTGLSVAFLDGEEAGARGSAHHAPQVAPGTFVINVDGAARLADAAAVEAGGPAEPLLAALDQAARHTGVPLKAGPMASDNRRYAAVGLPAIGIGMGMPGYQTPAETVDRVEATTLLAAANLVTATVRQLAHIPAPLGETL